jgi:hypothetical protein
VNNLAEENNLDHANILVPHVKGYFVLVSASALEERGPGQVHYISAYDIREVGPGQCLQPNPESRKG